MKPTHDRASLEGARVLVVEDEYYLADDLARALRGAGAHPVGPASSVDEASALLAEQNVDGAILDLNLHGVMAYGFAERLWNEQLPCVIVSGYSDDAVPEPIRNVPRLEKPVDVQTIVDKLSGELGHQLRPRDL